MPAEPEAAAPSDIAAQPEDSVVSEPQEIPSIVAMVDGEEISGAAYESHFLQAQQNALQQGMDVESPAVRAQIKKEVLDRLIGTELLVQASENNAVVIDDESVEAEYQNIVLQVGSQESLDQQIAQAGMTTEDLRRDILNQLRMQKYLRQQVEEKGTEISEEDMQAYYDQSIVGQEVFPSYEEVKEQVRAGLKSRQEQQIIENLVSELREAAAVEILLEEG